MFDRLRTRQSAITFDVGATGVRACQLLSRSAAFALRDYLAIDFPPAAPDPNPEDSTRTAPQDRIVPTDAARLARVASQGSFQGRDVAVLLAPPEIRFHTLRVPDNILKQPSDRVQQALAFEVSREARCEPSELEVRHWPLPPGHQQGLNVMAISLSTRRALEWVAAFEAQNLTLKRLDAMPCALVRFALQNDGAIATPTGTDEGVAAKDVWAVLECGFRQTTLTVVIGDQPAYIRCLPVSTDQWTRRIADAFDLPYAEADELKCRHGISLEGGGGDLSSADLSTMNDDDLPAVVFSILREPLDALVREIDLCVSYVMRSYPDLNVRRLVLAGGGAALRGMDEYLSLHLGVPVTHINAAISGSPAHRAGLAGAAAMGGAMLDLESAA